MSVPRRRWELKVRLRRTTVSSPRRSGYHLGMKPCDDFSDYYAPLLDGVYDCLDRIVLNAYYPMGQSGGGLRTWWRRLHGSDEGLSDGALRDMAGTFARRLRAHCAKQSIPFVETALGERKHQLAEDYRPEDPNFKGLFLVLTAKAPAPVWQVHRNDQGQITDLCRPQHWPFVKHYHFHLIDPEWGHVTIRMSGHPPFGAQVILNGHEWVERAARQRQWAVNKESNCFVEGSDYGPVNDLAHSLATAQLCKRLDQVCRRWIYSACLCFALPQADQQQSQFEYLFSCYQLELSRNFLFHQGSALEEVYQSLLDRTRKPLDIKQLKTIFGFKHRPHRSLRRRRTWPKMVKGLKTPEYDLTVFKVQWGGVLLKIYDKGQRVLRVEVTVHNAGQLGCGKLLPKLPQLLKRMRQILQRFLSVVQAAHLSFLDLGAFEQWAQPVQRGKRRLAGIHLDNVRNRLVLDAVMGLAPHPQGFMLKDVAHAVRERTRWSPKQYPVRKARYDLAKLRGKKLVTRIPGTRTYRCQAPGISTICAYLILREKVIKPLLAGVARPKGRPPNNLHPGDRHYIILRVELRSALQTLCLAA